MWRLLYLISFSHDIEIAKYATTTLLTSVWWHSQNNYELIFIWMSSTTFHPLNIFLFISIYFGGPLVFRELNFDQKMELSEGEYRMNVSDDLIIMFWVGVYRYGYRSYTRILVWMIWIQCIGKKINIYLKCFARESKKKRERW